MGTPRVYADFQNLDDRNRLRLTCAGTLLDLERHGIQLREGLTLTFYADDAGDQGNRDDLLLDGVVTFSLEEQCWVAVVDWNAIRNESDERTADGNGAATIEGPPISAERRSSS